MERPFIIMRQAKAGYLDGKRREFAEGGVYEVDATLYKAFVEDLGIADPFDTKAAAATVSEAPAAEESPEEAEPGEEPKAKGRRRGAK